MSNTTVFVSVFMRLTTSFGHCCTRCCSRCGSSRRSLLSKWRRRGPPPLPSGFGTGTGSGPVNRSGFASGTLRTACGGSTSTVLRSAAMSFSILWSFRSLACRSCSVACSKFCCCCCCSCCSSNKPSCSYCSSWCLLLWERRCGALCGLLFLVGIVYVIFRQEFCIWTLFFSAVCLQLYPECSAKSFPMCWLEKDVAYTVLGLFAFFLMCRNLSSSLILMIFVCRVCVLQLESC